MKNLREIGLAAMVAMGVGTEKPADATPKKSEIVARAKVKDSHKKEVGFYKEGKKLQNRINRAIETLEEIAADLKPKGKDASAYGTKIDFKELVNLVELLANQVKIDSDGNCVGDDAQACEDAQKIVKFFPILDGTVKMVLRPFPIYTDDRYQGDSSTGEVIANLEPYDQSLAKAVANFEKAQSALNNFRKNVLGEEIKSKP